ncbi:TetR/AcrR family transcriptional regulator [Arenibaculum pallidiluteum]|uniref:TetR/AcrR family transcriptional regulator n=1 Tax=Arenibaculum pallidiluteum TaxID=2812559 RepID=UPI001A956388|nr:TetR/AcrR family transcriptional regulator [Arenibaculum pallidiluteum]
MPNPDSGHQLTGASGATESGRSLRADAQRSVDALVAAARELFATKGVDATTREIADRAGVGMGTLYRRFPRRADLIGAVFREELDACANAARTLAEENSPFEAMLKWMQAYVQLIGTKRGLAKAVSSDDPVYVGMAARFDQQLRPAAEALYEAAAAAGEARPNLDAAEILAAVSALCMSTYDGRPDHPSRMVALFVEGLRLPR